LFATDDFFLRFFFLEYYIYELFVFFLINKIAYKIAPIILEIKQHQTCSCIQVQNEEEIFLLRKNEFISF